MKYKVFAMIGDYHPSQQPFWQCTYTDLAGAKEAADRTWDWLRVSHPDDSEDRMCVFVTDADDDTGEKMFYVLGNPECDVEDSRASND
jgi:hypothetical protein